MKIFPDGKLFVTLHRQTVNNNSYQGRQGELSYWRTGRGMETDAVVGDAAVGIEIKSTNEVKDNQLKGLRSFGRDYPDARLMVVSNDMYRRRKEIPVKEFLSDLWAGKVV